jgi:hypothetical protein
MEEKYKGFTIKVSPVKKASRWSANLDFSPALPGGNRGGVITHAAKRGYDTREKAEAAALAWAKAQIDQKAQQ